MRLWHTGLTIPLGTTRFLWLARRTVRISPSQARTHMHVLGKSGSGKSYFLAGLFLALHRAGMPATLIDPHGDLAELVLSLLITEGTFADPAAFEGSSIWTCRPPPRRRATCRSLPGAALRRPRHGRAGRRGGPTGLAGAGLRRAHV